MSDFMRAVPGIVRQTSAAPWGFAPKGNFEPAWSQQSAWYRTARGSERDRDSSWNL